MWNRKNLRTPGDKLWGYVTGLHRGEEHDPEEEMASLLPMARLVSDALKGGGEGPERLSEARLRVAIAKSPEPRPLVHRQWVLPALAVSGWATATLAFGLFAYESGMNRGAEQTRLTLAKNVVVPTIPTTLSEFSPVIDEVKPHRARKIHRPKHNSTLKKTSEPQTPAVAMPPAVQAHEIGSYEDDSLIASNAGTNIPDTPEEAEQANLLREGSAQLAQGEYEKAATSYEQAASRHPQGECALDALHFSGNIAERALNDPKRASGLYRREAHLARRLLERRESEKDAPATPVKTRLARALTSIGLLEKNPKMIQQAAEESNPASGYPEDKAAPSPE